jgi:hypothetical protein
VEPAVVYMPEEFKEAQLSAAEGPLQIGTDAEYSRGLRRLAPGLFQLRLLEVPSLTVSRVSEVPACGAQTARADEPGPRAESAEPESLGGLPRLPGQPTGVFYVVQGSLEVRPPDIVLVYSLQKCDRPKFESIIEDTLPFTADTALDDITIAAHSVAASLGRSVPQTRVALKVDVEGSDPANHKAVQARLQRGIEQPFTATLTWRWQMQGIMPQAHRLR